ncbi:MAG: hypothetical protein Q9163_006062 [Psora crenata]
MSLLSDFTGASNGHYLDPRLAFPEQLRRYCAYRPILLPKADRRRWIADPEWAMRNPHRWSPHSDLDWVVRELAYQRGKPLTERSACLKECFPVIDADDLLAQELVDDGSIVPSQTIDVVPNVPCPHIDTADGPDSRRGAATVATDVADDTPYKDIANQQSPGQESDEQQVDGDDTDDDDSGESLSSDGEAFEPETFSCDLCLRPDTQKMIECTSNSHGEDESRRWFHFCCVGLRSSAVPRLDDVWLCPRCEHNRFVDGPDKGCCDSDDQVCNANDSYFAMPIPKRESQNTISNSISAASTRSRPYEKVPKGNRKLTLGITETQSPQKSTTRAPYASSSPWGLTTISSKRGVRPWTDQEKAFVKDLLQEILVEGGPESRTERRWAIVSERLASRFQVHRTWTSVKNYWNREGRNATKIDERCVQQPARLITGVQDKDQRKAAREAKRKRTGPDNEIVHASHQTKRPKHSSASVSNDGRRSTTGNIQISPPQGRGSIPEVQNAGNANVPESSQYY